MAMTIITGNKGGGGSSHTPTEAPDSVQSVATAKILIALGEGEWAGNLDNTRVLFDGTPYGNADGTINFPDARWEFRPGTQAQEYIQGIPSVENEITVNTELKSSAPWVRAVANTQLSAVRIRFGWPALQQQKDNGDTVGYRIEYAIDVATDGGAYVEMLKAAIDDKTTSLYERSHRVNLPQASTGWQIRVRRLTENANSNRIADTMNIEAISEIIDAKLRYPGTALLYAEFNAKQFQSIPQISCIPDMAIIRVPDNYDPVRRTYTGTWTGGFKWAHSNNPAWVFYDLLLSERYGLGDRLESVQIDETELYRIAQYCDQLVPDGKGGSGTEPRFLCDVYIQSQEDAWTVLTDLAAVFRGMTYWGGEQIVTVCDMPEDVRYTFTRANVVNGQFTYSSSSEKTRYTTAAVSWSDPGNHYSDTVEMVSELRLVRRYGINQTQITAIGCTRQSEANRRGRWTLLSNSSDNTVSFSVGLDGAIPMPGRLIAVADYRHANASIGGRISAVDGRKITLDREPRAQAGDRLQVNLPSGITQARTVQAVNGRIVTVTTAYSERPEAEAAWAVDADDLALQLFRVVSIRDNNDNTYEITAVAHNPDKYARIDTGARLEDRPTSIMPPGVQQGPKNIGISSYSAVSQGIAITTMRATWDAVESAIAYEAEWRKDSGNWVSVPRTSALGFEVPGIYSGRYLVRARAVNASDIASLWVTSEEAVLTGKTGKPPMPVGFSASSDVVFGVRLTWGFPDGAADTLKTEIQYSKTSDGANPLLLSDVSYPQREYLQSGLAAGREFWYQARLVDRTGNQGDWTGWVRGVSSADAEDVLSYLTGQITETQLGQDLLAPIEDASKLQNMWSVKVAENANGKQYLAGIGVGVENTPEGMQSQVLIVANRFAVLNTADGAGTAVSTPFAIDGGQVFINDAFIKNASITSAKIKDAAITTAKINDASITNAKLTGDIYSDGFVSGSKGWRLRPNGSAELNDVIVRGAIEAKSFIGDVAIIGEFGNYTYSTSESTKTFYYRGSGYAMSLAVIVNGMETYNNIRSVMNVAITINGNSRSSSLSFSAPSQTNITSSWVASHKVDVPASYGDFAITVKITHSSSTGNGRVDTILAIATRASSNWHA